VRRLALALVHYPVLDREGELVTTAITNLDVHDMARTARTYGASDFFVVHPVAAQRLLAQRIKDHWTLGSGKRRIPDRAIALELVRVVESLDEAFAALGGRTGPDAIEVWTTAASVRGGAITTYADARGCLADSREGPPVLLLFGTGWGLSPELVANADVRLEPIVGRRATAYNHLSVRAACAITFDRLLG
jgi:hypothetical protein